MIEGATTNAIRLAPVDQYVKADDHTPTRAHR
jgi:hypothetical protein